MNKRKFHRFSSMLAVAVVAAATSGCVTYGNTHALLTPVGVAGYRTFKPDHAELPRDIDLPAPSTADHIASDESPLDQ
jgi:hypothetical protein